MANYGGFEDLNITTDAEGNVTGYGNNASTAAATVTTNSNQTPWWQSLINIVPSLANTILGNNQNQQVIQPIYATPSTSSGLGSSTILIVAVAAGILYLALKKK